MIDFLPPDETLRLDKSSWTAPMTSLLGPQSTPHLQDPSYPLSHWTGRPSEPPVLACYFSIFSNRANRSPLPSGISPPWKIYVFPDPSGCFRLVDGHRRVRFGLARTPSPRTVSSKSFSFVQIAQGDSPANHLPPLISMLFSFLPQS